MDTSISIDDNKTSHAELEEKADRLIASSPGIYTNIQLARKAREMQTRLESRQIINKYVCEDFTELDNTLIESFLGDIKDAAHRKNISDTDYEMICMRARKMTYAEISQATGLDTSTCYARMKAAQVKILEVESFGRWELFLEMRSNEQSNWYRIFRELMQ